MPYYVYLVECSDGSLYCGYTTDLTKRVKKHNNSRYGAKYTRSRRPVKLVYSEELETRSSAMKREAEIKSLSRKQKKALFNS
ncbi:GIY-YIG nuclease family protein [candidate division WWE3 bacterium]|nr:GIY-YIG nuclease family protein [candidate division WWE3 bacterium]